MLEKHKASERMFIPHGKKSDHPFVRTSPLREDHEAVFNNQVSEISSRHPWKILLHSGERQSLGPEQVNRTQHLKGLDFMHQSL